MYTQYKKYKYIVLHSNPSPSVLVPAAFHHWKGFVEGLAEAPQDLRSIASVLRQPGTARREGWNGWPFNGPFNGDEYMVNGGEYWWLTYANIG